MSNLQMIEELCKVVQLQSEIIEEQATALAQMGAVCSEEKRERARTMASAFCRDNG